MKYFFLCATFFVATTVFAKQDTNDNLSGKSIYNFKIKSLDGDSIDFAQFKGKKILIVNTASMCGYTSQYRELEALYERYKDRLVVVGFPSDNFGGQEYKEDKEIKMFCEKKFGVTFPLTTRVDVKGDNAISIYKYLCNKSENGVLDASINWNFNKFLIDENGQLMVYFNSKVKPDSEELLKYIE